MLWETILLTDLHLERGMASAAEYFSRAFAGATPHLAFLFASGYDRDEMNQIRALVSSHLKPQHWLGCSSGGVIGQGREAENQKAISISMANLPDVAIQPFHIAPQPFTDPQAAFSVLCEKISFVDQTSHFIFLADPFTFDIETFLRALDLGFPLSTKVGGLASGGRKPGDHVLLVDDGIFQTGLAGVTLSGALHIDTLVSQGCRPIGPPMFVTASRNHLILELDNRSPVELLRQIFDDLPEYDQDLFQRALSLGIALTTQKETFESGDFLIRQIIGGEPSSGHLAVGAHVEPYQVVQFHLRDPLSARRDLESVLKRHVRDKQGQPFPVGGLLFSCLGRGKQLYGLSNHDTDMFRSINGPLSLGGFFCNGEIGPVHGKTFVHGFTSVFCLFCPKGR